MNFFTKSLATTAGFFTLLAASQALARDDITVGAQYVPAHNGGAILIPASGLPQNSEAGVMVHTNARLLLPAAAPTQTKATAGPPYKGYNFETPASLACVYGLTTSANGCNPNVVTAVATGGSRAIAIVDAFHYPTALNDLKIFSTQFGLPVPNLTVVFASGKQPAGNSGWEVEMALDIEMAHSMAPNAKIYLVEAASASGTDLLKAVDAASQLVIAAGGGEVSMSWGSPEYSGETSYDSHFTSVGVTYFASTGDSPGVEWPSVSANVVAVGGTSLARQLGTLSLLHHTSWVDGGGGISSYVARPAYQSSIASLVGNYRGVPDIAAVADPNTGVWVYDSGNGGWITVGGTSVASPLVAGIVNASGHFYASSAVQLTYMYQKSAAGASNYTLGATGYCGPQAAYSVSAGWNPCLGIGSPASLQTQ